MRFHRTLRGMSGCGGAEPSGFRVRGLTIVLLCGIALGGCAMPRRTFVPDRNPSELSDAVFMHYLANVPVATVDEGMRGVLLLVGRTAYWPDFEWRRQELVSRGALRKGWVDDADRVLDKGTLAYMLQRIAKLPPGINGRLAGAMRLGERRYAVRDCVRAELLRYGVPSEPVTGGELHSAILAVERYFHADSGHMVAAKVK